MQRKEAGDGPAYLVLLRMLTIRPGSLVALHVLTKGEMTSEIEKGIEWLLSLQNADGGIPTFCRGWGKLPFDRSSPDITAHLLLAFNLWRDKLPQALKKKCDKVHYAC